MSIVAGVDFGTLSVRVSIFDSIKGRLGAASAEYPLHRKKEDPDYATQSHADHKATLRLKQRAAISHVVHTISAFSTQSNARTIHAASGV